MSETATVTIVGAGGKMGSRLSTNLLQHHHLRLNLVENSQSKRMEMEERGLIVSESDDAIPASQFVILAVPDTLLGRVSEEIVPKMRPNATYVILDPAAAYAGQLQTRDDITTVVAHPCHPSVFGKYLTEEEHNDSFGGIAAEQDVVIALYAGDEMKFEAASDIVRKMYAPVGRLHRTTVKQMAILEPTLTEVAVCMIGDFLTEVLRETVKCGVPEEAAKAMLYGHIQVALSNALLGINPFSDAAYIAMEYGRKHIINTEWKKIFEDDVLDEVIGEMLKLGHPVRH
ncbi:phosphogluconate dehydrogenase C-terminal domain-containing protein [Alicyclobacillus sp. SO9]|uniref:phosphogluconate dehydrogenase C-terminal domain-containing protein n=1 Tax=Alicyclobacillus sp. SO9 TaxID=2665646 RepID=UPI0018E82A91|nr:phosphogluconate dehydrogenase C-terminal domain-containing protein [Alicyclobacillus sp. SO9]QQE77945.1 oxidoreductase [Alicyclobacillus sp. SO9]